MPNHVMNRVTFDCSEERLKEILSAICYDENADGADITGPGTIDFNKITPMPPSLDIESGSRTIDSVSLYLTSLNPDVHHFGEEKLDHEAFRALLAQVGKRYGFVEYDPAMSQEKIAKCTQYTDAETLLEMGKTAVDNQRQYGATTWYEWRTRPDTWGTKWNSYYPGEYDGGNEITFQTAWSAPHPIVEKLSRMYPDVTIHHECADEGLYWCGRYVYKAGEQIESYEPGLDRERVEMSIDIWGMEIKDMGLVLNADGTDYLSIEYPYYKVMELGGTSVLYSKEGMTASDIPLGMYVYRLRKDLEGDHFVSLDRETPTRKEACVISKTPLELGESGVMHFTAETQPVLTDEEQSFGQYREEPSQESTEVMSLG